MHRKIHKDIQPLIDKIVHKIKLTAVIEEYERTTYIDFLDVIDINLENYKYNNYEELASNAPIKKYAEVEFNRAKTLRDIVNIYPWWGSDNLSVIDVSINLSNHKCLKYVNDLMPNKCIEIKLIRVDKKHNLIIEFHHRSSIAFESGCFVNNDTYDEFCVKCCDLHNEVNHKNKDMYCVPLPKRYYFSNGNKKCNCPLFTRCYKDMWDCGNVRM